MSTNGYCSLMIVFLLQFPSYLIDVSDCSELAADLVFLIDSCESEDVGPSQWHLSLDAVTSLLSALDHQGSLTGRPTHVHYGLVTVSDTVNVTIPLGPHDKVSLRGVRDALELKTFHIFMISYYSVISI